MVPNINPRGHSFKGVASYLTHDKGKAKTSERVAWTSTHNLYTEDIEEAALFMAWTDKNRDLLKTKNGNYRRGAEAENGNVYHYSLSWSPDETPSREEMERHGHSSVAALGLAEHQYFFVSHTDEPHPHLHAVINLVHPKTGKIASVYRDRKILDHHAHEYEQEHGIKCDNRDNKYQAWEEKKRAFSEKERREDYTKKVTAAYQKSDSAKGFQAALGLEHLSLARGNRRGFVVVDERGEVYALNRLVQFDGDIKGRGKTKKINERLKSVNIETLPMADTLAMQRKAEHERERQKREETKAAAKEAKATKRAEYEAQQARIKVLEWGKEQRERLEKAQRIERQRLEGRLKWERQDKEASIRKRWHFHIEQNRQSEAALQAKLDRGGVRGVLFRLRHGKEAQQDIENARKSRLNAEKRQKEEIDALDKRDRYHHGKMSQRHKNEQQALEQDIGTALARGGNSHTRKGASPKRQGCREAAKRPFRAWKNAKSGRHSGRGKKTGLAGRARGYIQRVKAGVSRQSARSIQASQGRRNQGQGRTGEPTAKRP